MALSYKLATLDGLDDAVKGLYKQVGTEFVLDVTGAEGADDVQGLRNALQAQKDNVAALKQEKLDQEAAALQAEQERLKEAGKHEELAANQADELARLKAGIAEEKRLKLEAAKTSEAGKIAAQYGKDASSIAMLARLIEGEMSYNDAGILQGQNGETLVQMGERVNTCGAYDALLKGSGASGGDLGSPGGSSHKKLSEMTGAEEIAFAKSNPEDYTAMLAK